MNKRDFFKTGLLGAVALLLSRKALSLEYYPNDNSKKWAVLYSTWCGSSRDTGIWISEGMNGIANVFDVREEPDLSHYEYLVIGGSIRAGKVSGLLSDYIEKNKNLISNKVRGLFVVCGNRMQAPGPEQTTNLIDNHLALLCGAANVPSKVFLGRVTYGLLDEQSKNMLKGFNMPEYDNLRRTDCMAFGREVLANSGL